MKDWIELPVIGPEHINVARNVLYQFTGDLNAPISTLIPFPGKEKHFLKAQLVRITHSCEIIPRAVYTLNEEDGNFWKILLIIYSILKKFLTMFKRQKSSMMRKESSQRRKNFQRLKAGCIITQKF